jgi:hypothetical protein
MGDMKKRVKALADTLYEFSGQDFTDRSVQKHFQSRLMLILRQMQSMGVYVTLPEFSGYDNFGRPVKAVFDGVHFEMESVWPEYKIQMAYFEGTPL